MRPFGTPRLAMISRRYLLWSTVCLRFLWQRRHAQLAAQHAAKPRARATPNFHVRMLAAAWSTRSSQSLGSGVVGSAFVLMNSPFAITAKYCVSASLSSSQVTYVAQKNVFCKVGADRHDGQKGVDAA